MRKENLALIVGALFPLYTAGRYDLNGDGHKETIKYRCSYHEIVDVRKLGETPSFDVSITVQDGITKVYGPWSYIHDTKELMKYSGKEGFFLVDDKLRVWEFDKMYRLRLSRYVVKK